MGPVRFQQQGVTAWFQVYRVTGASQARPLAEKA